MSQHIAAHEPEEELLSAQDAWEDYVSLAQALAEKRKQKVPLWVDSTIYTLMHNLVAAGVCQDEEEVMSRSVQAFFASVYPQTRKQLAMLRESQAEYKA